VSSADQVRPSVEAVWRIESPKLVAALTRMVRDIGVAEDLAQDALVAALEQWPASGIPRNAGAWLMATAKHRAIDYFRRNARLERKHDEIGHDLEEAQLAVPDLDASLDDDVGDDLLRLMFTACHPVLPKEARVALTLKLLGGLTTEEIARAFVVPDATIAQRIVRAKRTIAAERVPYDVPRGADRTARLGSVLEAVYLIFNEGYAATAGDHWMRPELCKDAMRLGRVLAGLMPEETEVHGLVALMELQASRQHARTGPSGEPILLLDQNRARWDRVLIRHGLAALQRAEALAPSTAGTYVVQAQIAACHARARTAADTDWPRIAALYARLMQLMPSPIVELNRAVALGMALGPAVALEVVDALKKEKALAEYHLLPSVRGDLLGKLGRFDEAARECDRAARLTKNARERELLRSRAARFRASGRAAPDRPVSVEGTS
jgi:RNA polymerase sigma-70 factor (ECF subfamily)